MVTELRRKFEMPGFTALLAAFPEIEPSREGVGSAEDFAQRLNLGVVTRSAVAMGEPST
jgi:hypothetical protein